MTEKTANHVFGVVQEGGSSTELYFSLHDTRAEADAFRQDCAENGSYRTSPVIPLPAHLAEDPDAINAFAAVLMATTRIDYPEVDAPEPDMAMGM